jgi:protein-disulfide isomerase
MTSGKQSKRLRRSVPAPPPRPGPPRPRRASRKVLIAAAALLALAGTGIGLGVALTGGSSSSNDLPATGSLAGALPNAAEVQRLFEGIPQNGNVLGSPGAPATMVEYVDLQCPYCQQFETQALPPLITRYVRTGKLKVEARPIAFIGPDSERGRAAAVAAAEQDRMFNFMALLYFGQGAENSGWLSEETVGSAAASIPGLDVRRLLRDRDSDTVRAREQKFDALAQSDHVRATPTILAGKSGRPLQEVTLASPTDATSLVAAIEQALG